MSTTTESTARERFDYDHVLVLRDGDDYYTIAKASPSHFVERAAYVASRGEILRAPDGAYLIVPVALAAEWHLLTEDACERLGIPYTIVADLAGREPFDETD